MLTLNVVPFASVPTPLTHFHYAKYKLPTRRTEKLLKSEQLLSYSIFSPHVLYRLFICCVFNDVVSSLDCWLMNDEYGCIVAWLKALTLHLYGVTKKTQEKLKIADIRAEILTHDFDGL